MSETLGKRIRRLREAQEIGLREAARKLDISPAYLSRIETDEEKTPPGEEVLTRIAKLLGDSPDELFHHAGRIPSDVSDVIKNDPAMPEFLRTATRAGYSGTELLKRLMESTPKKGGK